MEVVSNAIHLALTDFVLLLILATVPLDGLEPSVIPISTNALFILTFVPT